MGRLQSAGVKALDMHAGEANGNRIGLILGTGWSDPNVLHENGFKESSRVSFEKLGVYGGEGAGHPNVFLFGTWHNEDVVISQGRIHLYQEQPGSESLLRRWMSVFIALLGTGQRVVITSSVGGLSKLAKTGVVVQPTGLISAHLPQPYLHGAKGEFVPSEHLLWNSRDHRHAATQNPPKKQVFYQARMKAKLKGFSDATHMVLRGPGFGGAAERELWTSWGCDTVGMSLDPELRLIALENNDREPSRQIRVFASFIVTDDHDLPNHAEITAAAKGRAPQLGTFLSHVVQAAW